LVAKGNPVAEPVLFEARLSPHRSLSAGGFAVVMSVLALASFALGVSFLMMGAWPVCGFFGLDVALVWLAFRVNYRDARAYEDIRLTANLLSVRQVSAKGAARETDFNPRWVRLEKTEDEHYGVTRVALISRGIFLIVGAFLPSPYKGELAKRLAVALAEARR
jgi:uncharacterized membrane protein